MNPQKTIEEIFEIANECAKNNLGDLAIKLHEIHNNLKSLLTQKDKEIERPIGLLIANKELEELAELLMQSENLAASIEMLKQFSEKCWKKGNEYFDLNNK